MAGTVPPGAGGGFGDGVAGPPDDPAAADRFWLYRDHCPRLSRPTVDASGREWVADTRVFALDMAAVAAVAARAVADDLPALIYTTRRGVPYVVLPGGWCDAVALEDGGRWGFAVASRYFVRWLVANRPDVSDRAAPTIDVPGLIVRDGTTIGGAAELGEEYRSWEL